jgi:hypothetical protein
LKWRAHRLCSPNGAGLFVAGDASHSWQAQMHVNATGLAYVLDSRQPYLRAKRRMISPNIGSFTFSAACEAESHFNALLFFWPLFILAPYLKWKDAHFTDDST